MVSANRQRVFGFEGLLDLLGRGLGVDEGHLDAHLGQGHGEQVVGAAVEGAGGDDMLAGLADVQDRQGRGGLTGRGRHGAHATLHLGDLGLEAVGGRVGQAGVEEAGRLQVEQLGDMLGAVVLEGRALDDGQDARFAGFGFIAPLHGDGVDFPVRVHL